MIETSFLKQLDRFSLILDRKLNSNYSGERKSSAIGEGFVLQDYVQYVPGDDFRKIDWKVFARSDKLYIRRYEEERNLTVHILIDVSGSMNYGKKHKKSEFASMVGIGFAYIALKKNERFLLSTFAEQFQHLKPRRGRRQLAAMVEYLNKIKPEGKTKFADALRRYHKHHVSSRSMVVIISDFLYDIEEVRDVCLRYRGHDVKLIQVLDEVEHTLAVQGEFNLVDTETKTKRQIHVTPLLRKRYLEAMADHQAELAETALQTGARFYTASTEQQIFDVFWKILG